MKIRGGSAHTNFRGVVIVALVCVLALLGFGGCGKDDSDVTIYNAKLLASMESTGLAGKPSPLSWEWSQFASGKPVDGVQFATVAEEMQSSADREVKLYSAAITKMKDGESRDIYRDLLVAYKEKAAAISSLNAALDARDDAARQQATADYRAALASIGTETSRLTALPGYETYAQGLITRQ